MDFSSQQAYRSLSVDAREGSEQRRSIDSLDIARVNHYAIAETQGLACPHRQTAVLRLVVGEVVYPEDVGPQQAVGARMPIRRVPGVGRVVHHQDANCMAFHRSEV